jgi:hypothetical protein
MNEGALGGRSPANAQACFLIVSFLSHANKLGSLFVKRSIADNVLTAQFLCSKRCLMLFQYRNNLFFAETASLHRLSPSWRTG